VFRVRLWGVTLTDERHFREGCASAVMLVAGQTCLMVGREIWWAVKSPVYRIWSITVVWTRPFLTDDLSAIIVERTHGLQLDPGLGYPHSVKSVSKSSKQVG
jgi:hypothetical protein